MAVSQNVIAMTCHNYIYIKMNLIFSLNYYNVLFSKIYPSYLRRYVVANNIRNFGKYYVVANNWSKILNLILINGTTSFRLFVMICRHKYWSVFNTNRRPSSPFLTHIISLSLFLPSHSDFLSLYPFSRFWFSLSLYVSHPLSSPPPPAAAAAATTAPLSLSLYAFSFSLNNICFDYFILFFVLFYY